MTINRASAILAALALIVLGRPASTAGRANGEKRDITALDLINASTVLDIAFSPDGSRLLYEVERPDLEKNQYTTELWARSIQDGAGARRLAVGQSSKSLGGSGRAASLKAQWTADGRSVVYLRARDSDYQLRRVLLADERDEELYDADRFGTAGGAVRPTFYRVSPDGRSIAMVAAQARRAKGEPSGGVVIARPGLRVGLGQTLNAGLWLFDVASKTMKRMTPPEIHVGELAWSPDGARLAFSAAVAPDPTETKTLGFDLYILDIRTEKTTALIQQPGWDKEPVWSPDGHWVAFLSQKGDEDWSYNSWIAVISADGGAPRYLFDDFQRKTATGPQRVTWTKDSRNVLFNAGYRFLNRVFSGSVTNNTVEEITPDGQNYGPFSLSGDSRHVAVSASDGTTPPDVYVADCPWRNPRRLTDLHPHWSTIRAAQVDTITWKSRDGLFDLSGVVIKPPDYQTGRRYPLIMYLTGGPHAMVDGGFPLGSGTYPFLVLAAKGYVVFFPNSRGHGGFGADIKQVMPKNTDFMPGPFEDVTAGVDELISRGIADPDRMAVTGFSMGACQTAYVITRTARFRAAGIFDGSANLLREHIVQIGDAHRRKLWKDQLGFGSPWDPKTLQVLMEHSPILAMDRVKTPTLLEFAGDGWLFLDSGYELYSALQFFKVPSLFIVYPRSGHQVSEPKLREESYVRQLAWFDYWLLGKGENPLETAKRER